MDQPIGVRLRFQSPAVSPPPLWGRSPRWEQQHAVAARVQAQYLGWVVWFGETSGSFYAMDASGLYRRESVDDLVVLLWQRTRHSFRPQRPGFESGVGAGVGVRGW